MQVDFENIRIIYDSNILIVEPKNTLDETLSVDFYLEEDINSKWVEIIENERLTFEAEYAIIGKDTKMFEGVTVSIFKSKNIYINIEVIDNKGNIVYSLKDIQKED